MLDTIDTIDTPPLTPLHKSAARDLIDGARQVDLWARLGWLDVKRRYRRTALGPFWNVISLAVFVATIGAMGVGLWKQDPYVYVPYLTAGILVWTMISTSLGEGCSVLIANTGMFRNSRCDFSLLAYVLVWRNFLTFLHHLLVYALVVLVLAPHLLSPATLLTLPGLALLAVNGIWITLLLGIACLRFRDIQQLVASILQIGLFLTPIIWPLDQLEGTARLVFVHLNPLYHCVEVLRAPLLGKVPTPGNYIGVVGVAAVGWIVAYWVFARFRRRITYWI
jgi:ABC-type polysaccharide/polyol phosphate export permease